MKTLSLTLIFIFVLTSGVYAADIKDQTKTLRTAISVVEEMMNAPDDHIPKDLMARAKGIIIFPTMIKGAFIFGARYGKGVASVRSPKTGKWGPPAFHYTTGLSWGLQIGGEAVDLILLIMTERGMRGLLKDQFTLGGDAAISAGPVGRHAEAAADIMMQGEIYSYSRSKGAFAGISLKGTVITADQDGNHDYYRKFVSPRDILLRGAIKKYPESAQRFINRLNKLAPSNWKPKTKKTSN